MIIVVEWPTAGNFNDRIGHGSLFYDARNTPQAAKQFTILQLPREKSSVIPARIENLSSYDRLRG